MPGAGSRSPLSRGRRKFVVPSERGYRSEMGTTYANLRNQVLGGDPAAAGKFSLARKRKSGRAREYLFRAQCIARVGETRATIPLRKPNESCRLFQRTRRLFRRRG